LLKGREMLKFWLLVVVIYIVRLIPGLLKIVK